MSPSNDIIRRFPIEKKLSCFHIEPTHPLLCNSITFGLADFFQSSPLLVKFNFSGCLSIQDSTLHSIVMYCHNLEELGLSHCTSITWEGLMALVVFDPLSLTKFSRKLVHLRELRVKGLHEAIMSAGMAIRSMSDIGCSVPNYQVYPALLKALRVSVDYIPHPHLLSHHCSKGSDATLYTLEDQCSACQAIVPPLLMEDHATICFQKRSCPNRTMGCDAIMPLQDVAHHLALDCKFYVIVCPVCKGDVKRSCYSSHTSTHCNHDRIVSDGFSTPSMSYCPLQSRGCPVDNLTVHIWNEQHFSVSNDMAKHLQVCPYYTVHCCFCHQSFLRTHISSHSCFIWRLHFGVVITQEAHSHKSNDEILFLWVKSIGKLLPPLFSRET